MTIATNSVKAAGFLMMPAIPMLAPLGYSIHLPWLASIVIFIAVPLFDMVIGVDKTNPIGQQRFNRWDGYFYWIPHLYVASWLICFAWLINLLVNETLPPMTVAGLTIAIGLSSSFATCAAHELLHRGTFFDYWVARIVMAICAYGHFNVEHLHHHATAGIQEAGTVPCRGEGLYAFIWRNFKFSLGNSFRVEEDIRRRRGYSMMANRVVQQYALTLAIAAVLAYFYGVVGFAVFIVQALYAIFSLEMIQYFEHYGLERLPNSPMSAKESWNSNSWLTNAITLNITRHSDHHLDPKIPYQSLQPHPDGPVMPAGYFTLAWLALIPPLWRHVIDPILDQVSQKQPTVNSLSTKSWG